MRIRYDGYQGPQLGEKMRMQSHVNKQKDATSFKAVQHTWSQK
jgi:hypothetical protein